MSENSLKALSILALIIGASGLGIGAYLFMQAGSFVTKGDDGDDGDDGVDGENSVILRVYYNSSFSSHTCSPINTYLPISELNITFNINPGESAYFHYTCTGGTWQNTYVSVGFLLDGKLIPSVGAGYSNVAAGPMSMSSGCLSMQYTNKTFSEGLHEITVARRGGDTYNYVSGSILWVQIYKT